jgi:hypothetical protein
MAKMLGDVTVSVGGEEYRLRLTMRGIATLQDEFGKNLDPILNLQPGDLPHFGVCIRVVELALKRYHPDASPDVADDILTQDMGIFGQLLEAAFPQGDGQSADGKKTQAAG